MGALRYFKDDRGLTVVERGVDTLPISQGRKTLLRFLAISGMLNVLVFCFFNLPNGLIGAHSTEWPRDVQDRSYLTDRLCGEGTDRACPGPTVPLPAGDRSAYMNRDGGLSIPAGGAKDRR